jgi:hypothetical protein
MHSEPYGVPHSESMGYGWRSQNQTQNQTQFKFKNTMHGIATSVVGACPADAMQGASQ